MNVLRFASPIYSYNIRVSQPYFYSSLNANPFIERHTIAIFCLAWEKYVYVLSFRVPQKGRAGLLSHYFIVFIDIIIVLGCHSSNIAFRNLRIQERKI